MNTIVFKTKIIPVMFILFLFCLPSYALFYNPNYKIFKINELSYIRIGETKFGGYKQIGGPIFLWNGSFYVFWYLDAHNAYRWGNVKYGQKYFVKVNGVNFGPYTYLSDFGISPSGNKFYYTYNIGGYLINKNCHGGKWFVFIDYQILGPYEKVYGLKYSPQSDTPGFTFKLNNQYFIHIGGKLYGGYAFCSQPFFAESSDDFWFFYSNYKWDEKKEIKPEYICINGKIIGPCAHIQSPVFSPNGKIFGMIYNIGGIYSAKYGLEGGKYYVYLKNKTYGGFTGAHNLFFSPSGKYNGFLFYENGKNYLVLNGKIYGGYEWVWRPIFSPDGLKFAYSYRTESGSFINYNGKIMPAPADFGNIEFDNKGNLIINPSQC
ncbi:MAG: hypothetical protein A2Y33_14630 [Spirochaetes bacterium GWF1_51_8]|nr:MAG: hypothetical protein A2Y33_14630 [Spirochaetes bacterium GWF1_51_8]